MADVFGVTEQGLVIKTLDVIRAERNAKLLAAFNTTSLDLSDESVDGQYVGIESEREANAWEVIEAVSDAGDPDKATGAAQDAICVLTGTFRRDATQSAVFLTCTGSPSTTVVAGSRAKTSDPEQLFELVVNASITALAAWAPSTLYDVADRVTNAGNVYVCTTTGTSASSGGPTTTAADITDGSVHWRFVGEGTGAGDALAKATETGPIVAVSGLITEIDTQVAGWQGVMNLLDATPGTNRTSNEALRLLRDAELATQGSTPIRAARGELLRLPGVTSVSAFNNNTDFTDGDGVPPHSVEFLVEGGDDDAIRERLLDATAMGIRTHGTIVGTVVDDEGNDQTIKFSRPTLVPIFVTITLTKIAKQYPSDGAAQIKLAVVTYGNALGVGADAVATSLGAQAFKVAGVFDVPRSGSLGGTLIGTTASPTTDTTVTITSRQRASYDTTRVVVNDSANGGP